MKHLRLGSDNIARKEFSQKTLTYGKYPRGVATSLADLREAVSKGATGFAFTCQETGEIFYWSLPEARATAVWMHYAGFEEQAVFPLASSQRISSTKDTALLPIRW